MRSFALCLIAAPIALAERLHFVALGDTALDQDTGTRWGFSSALPYD